MQRPGDAHPAPPRPRCAWSRNRSRVACAQHSKVRRVKALYVLFLVGCGSTAHVRTFTAMDKTSILGVIEAQAAAWNKGDLAGYMDGYAKSDDLVFTSGGNVRKGWQATHDTFQKKYAQDKSKMGTL